MAHRRRGESLSHGEGGKQNLRKYEDSEEQEKFHLKVSKNLINM